MLVFALLISSAVAIETGLNVTESDTAQSQLSTASSSASEPTSLSQVSSSSSSPSALSAPETVTAVIVTLSEVSSSTASSTSSSSLSASATITDGPIHTNFCNSYEGRNCERLPEMPYWYDVTPGNPVYGFTPTAQQNPWAYFFSFTESGQPPSALSSASSCSLAWYTNYTTWLTTAKLTYGEIVPQTTATVTLDAFTATDEYYGSTTGTSIFVETDTYTVSGKATSEVVTETEYEEAAATSTVIQIATTETLIYTSYSAAFYPSYTWKAQPPCCSGCTIYAGSVEVMYFPPATAASGNKTSTQPPTVVQSGFTFISPSIYMALQTLAASDLCGQVGSEITSATTLAFAENKLSTVPAYSQDGSIYTFSPYWQPTAYTPATFGTAACTSVTTVTGVAPLENVTVSYNPCYPYISIPPQIQTADPLWATCTSQWHFVLYDPPYVISQGTGIGAFSSSPATTTTALDTTTSPALETTSSVASTGPTPTAPTVSPTTTATLQPTTATSAPVQPASSESSTIVQPTTASSDPVQPASESGIPTSVDPATSSSVAIEPGNGQSTSVVIDPGTSASTSPTPVDPGTGSSTTPAAVQPGTGASSSAAGGASNAPTTPAVVTIGSSTITANSASGFIIGSTTLTPGGQVTVDGSTVSLASNGATIVIGSSTQALVTTPASSYVIGSQTLSAGGAPIVVSGTTYSLQSAGASVVVGSSTKAITALLGTSTPAYVIASSQTLEAGGSAITVSGNVVSLQSGGSSVVIDGTGTEALSAFLGSATTSASDLAGIIATIGGFGTLTTGSTTSSTGVSSFNGTQFTGSAVEGKLGSIWAWGTVFAAVVAIVGWI